MSKRNSGKRVKAIRIADAYIIQIVEEERAKRGDATATRTAAGMILERRGQIEISRFRDSHQGPLAA